LTDCILDSVAGIRSQSYGSLLPLLQPQFTALMNALMKSNGGVLVVAETMDGNRYA
jgi:hypothetical protein